MHVLLILRECTSLTLDVVDWPKQATGPIHCIAICKKEGVGCKPLGPFSNQDRVKKETSGHAHYSSWVIPSLIRTHVVQPILELATKPLQNRLMKPFRL
jgi:hypothetical protein